MPIFRKILFYIFVLIYLILCPIFIFRVLGIVFIPEMKGFLKTGIIYVSSIPSGAAIDLNGKRLHEKTPATLRSLIPGEYTLALSLDNYLPWQKTTYVAPEKTSILDKILLIPEHWIYRNFSTEFFQKLIDAHDNPYFLISRGNFLKDIFAYGAEENFAEAILSGTKKIEEPWALFPPEELYSEAKLLKIITADHSPFIIFQVEFKDQPKFLLVEIKNKTVNVEDITDLFPVMPENIRWEGNNKKNIFSLQENYINRIDAASKAVYPRVLNSIISFDLADNSILALSNNYILQHTNFEGIPQEIPQENFKLSTSALEGKKPVTIKSETNHTLFFLTGNGALFTSRAADALIESGAEDIINNPKDKRYLIRTSHKIGILDFLKETGETSPDKNYILTWVVDDGRDIRQAFWVNEGSHILYRDRDQVFIVESEHFTEPVKKEILEVKGGSDIYYSDKNGALFYLERETGQLSALEVLSKNKFISLPLFEREETEKQ